MVSGGVADGKIDGNQTFIFVDYWPAYNYLHVDCQCNQLAGRRATFAVRDQLELERKTRAPRAHSLNITYFD